MNNEFSIVYQNGIPLISVDCINKTGMFKAYYSTGFGGFSVNMPGGCSMNLNIFKRTEDGVESWRKNFDIFCTAAQVPGGYNSLVAQREIHSSITHIVTKADCKADIFEVETYKKADGQITADDVPLFVYASDCPTLILADDSTGIFGTAHCGWKNSLNDTIRNWIAAFKYAGGNVEQAIVAIGPSLCQECFEVGEEVRQLFINYDRDFENFMYRKGEKTHIDLNKVNASLLEKEGILPHKIYSCGICNRTEFNLPSYRRDKGLNAVLGGVIYKVK